ncbi:MAG TPA: polyprenyl synthetase family protein [Actinomycetota bacterium]|nr:polyprenyl synthetase family protein [Actinomycetota bacterium]
MAAVRPEPVREPGPIAQVRARVDAVLVGFLGEVRAELAGADPRATVLVDELLRLVRAGGKRIRPALCYWGYRAAGGADGEAIVRAAAALELLHTFALIHDDVMDRTPTRRGVAATHVRFARDHGPLPEAERLGSSLAILAGDLAMVLADRLLDDSGFPPAALLEARRRYHRMRTEMAVGQLLDLTTPAAGPEEVLRISALKTAAYTTWGPLEVGAVLAGASAGALAALERFALPLGQAFQVRDDLEEEAPEAGATVLLALAREGASEDELAVLGRAASDPEAAARSRGIVEARGARVRARALLEGLVAQAVEALEGAAVDPEAREALGRIARALLP